MNRYPGMSPGDYRNHWSLDGRMNQLRSRLSIAVDEIFSRVHNEKEDLFPVLRCELVDYMISQGKSYIHRRKENAKKIN